MTYSDSMKRLLLIACSMITVVAVNAVSFTVDGIHYTSTGTTASVTCSGGLGEPHKNLTVVNIPSHAKHSKMPHCMYPKAVPRNTVPDQWQVFPNIMEIDYEVNVGDVSTLYGDILSGKSNSDLNGDGMVNAGDVSELYRIIMGQ